MCFSLQLSDFLCLRGKNSVNVCKIVFGGAAPLVPSCPADDHKKDQRENPHRPLAADTLEWNSMNPSYKASMKFMNCMNYSIPFFAVEVGIAILRLQKIIRKMSLQTGTEELWVF